MPNTIPAAGEAMPSGPSPAYVDAWSKCRELADQLSEALTNLASHGDDVFAYVLPAGHSHNVGFGRIEAFDLKALVPLPVDQVEQLSKQLAIALDAWSDQTGVPLQARVAPASSGLPFYFENMKRGKDLPRGSEAARQLGDILQEAGRIIRANPELKIERINISEHGVHTFRKVEGAAPVGGEDL